MLAWGDNTHGQSAVATKYDERGGDCGGLVSGVALRADGTVLVWGQNAYGIASPPTGLLNASQIATGEDTDWPWSLGRAQFQFAVATKSPAALAAGGACAGGADGLSRKFSMVSRRRVDCRSDESASGFAGLQTSASGNYVRPQPTQWVAVSVSRDQSRGAAATRHIYHGRCVGR